MSLRVAATKGLIWVGLDKSIVGGVKLATQILLARILIPADFGLVAIGLLCVNTLSLFNVLGIDVALVQRKNNNIDEAADTSFFILPVIGLVLFLISFFLAPVAADFYKEDVLVRIIRFFSVMFLFNAFSVVPGALLTRDLQFKKKMIPDVGSVLVYSVIAVWGAIKYKSVYAIVYGYIASVIVNLILLWVVSSWRPKFRFRWNLARELISYGRFILGTSIISFFLTQGDNALIGRMLNITVLGFYAMAYTISNLAANEIAHVLSQVMFPVFSRLQDDRDKLGQSYLIALKYTLLLAMPVSLGIMVLGDTLIGPVLSEKWLPCVLVMQLLCWHGLFRAVHVITSFLIDGYGRPKLNQDIILGQLLGLAVIIYPLTVKYGIIGTAIAVTFMRLLVCWVTIQTCLDILKIGWNTFWKFVWLPIAGSMIMFGAVFLNKRLFFGDQSLLHLVILILTGIVTYIVFVLCISRQTRDQLKEIFSYLGQQKQKKEILLS